MKRHIVLGGATAVAVVIALALFLRPSRSISPRSELGTPAHIAPAARAVIRSKMVRHREQLGDLVIRVVALDYDGAARVGGEIFDEPALARPITGDELNGLLPEAFFELQDALRASARRVVEAAARKDGAKLAEEFSGLSRTCVACHALYLNAASASERPPL
jgi:hypothetical protein